MTRAAMTSKERLRTALLGGEVDHLAFSPNLAYLFESLPERWQALGHMGFCREVGADLLNRFCPCPVRSIPPEALTVETFKEGDASVTRLTTPLGSIRSAHRKSEDGNTHFLTEHPLKTEEDCKVQLWIEEHTRLVANEEPVKEALRMNDDALCIGMLLPRGKSAFQNLVEYHLGTEELVYAQADYPETLRSLQQAMAANNHLALKISAASEYEFFLTWEDSSTQNYSPAQYAEFIAPEITEWCRILKENGKHYIQHACGHVKALLPQMREHGLLAVESLSPIPTGNVTMKEARALLGRELGIIGGIEPTEFLNRSLEDLGPYVEEVIDAASGGPFILANSDSCPPGVAVEKFRLVAEIARATRG